MPFARQKIIISEQKPPLNCTNLPLTTLSIIQRQTDVMMISSLFRLPQEPTIPELLQKGNTAFENSQYDEALAHFYDALKKERRQNGNDSIIAAQILHTIGLVLAASGDSFAAMNSFEEALQIRQEKLGPGSEESAETTAQMIKVLDEIRIQSGVGERQLVKGVDSNNSSMASVDVGTNLLEWGEYKEAERVLRECLQNVNSNKDVSDAERLKTLSAMAALDRAQGKYEEAKEFYLEALKTARKMESNSASASSANFKGKSSSSPSEAAGAVPLEVDMTIINSISGYAEILRKGKELWQAEELHKKVRNMLLSAKSKRLNIKRQSIAGGSGTGAGNNGGGSNDFDENDQLTEIELQLAVSHTQLGCTVFAQKKYQDAILEHQAALEIRLRRLEFTDALISESFNYCAETLCAMGRGGDALPLSLHAVHVRKEEYGTNHPSYAHALCVLAMCYLNVGRSQDAYPIIEQCLRICEMSFSENHANLIQNLLVQGDILRSLGQLSEASFSYRKAEKIHAINFKDDQKDFQLEECQRKIKEVMAEMLNEGPSSPTPCLQSSSGVYQRCKIKNGGTPVIVVTDIGRDIDDAIALVTLASLKRMCILNPLAVIVTLAPEEDRACLARVTLDSLGLHDIPIGVGSDGGSKGGIELDCFQCVYGTNKRPFHFESGASLMSRILNEVEEPNSVKLVCISSLKDVCSLIKHEKDLFFSKIQEVVIMGGATYSQDREQLIPDETAYNNHCDIDAATYVYEECQKNKLSTTTITRHAAYGCPFPSSFLENLQDTHHILASEICSANLSAMNKLWTKVNLPPGSDEREKLPERCDRDWFLNFFRVKQDDSSFNWEDSSVVYFYDPFAILHCVEAYREIHFSPKCYKVHGVVHRITGVPETDEDCSGILNKENLIKEIAEMLHQAFTLSLTKAFSAKVNLGKMKKYTKEGED